MSDDITRSDIEYVLANDPTTKGKKISWPKADKVKALRPWLDEILKAIGVRSAYISDQSSIGDFEPLFEDGEMDFGEKGPEKRCSLKSVSEDLGVEVAFKDLLIDVAERMRAKVKKL
jgi:hypothetical protein